MSIQENPNGGRRQKQDARFDLIPYEALRRMARAFAEGEAKYGRLDRDPRKPNWTGLDVTGEQSPVSHALKHLALYVSGVNTDPETGEPEDHLGHALANLAMMSWFADVPFAGKTYPEMLASVYEKGDRGGGDESEDFSGDSRGDSGDTGGGDCIAADGGGQGISTAGTAGITWCPYCQALHSTAVGRCDKQLAAEGVAVAARDGRSG